jgi:hypothetical protein
MSLGNVTTQRDHCNPHCPAIYAYIDTVEVFFSPFRTREPYLYQTIERISRVKPCRDALGRLYGYRLILNQPDKHKLVGVVDHVINKYRGVLSRLDIALDIQPETSLDHALYQALILQQVILRRQPKGSMHDEEAGVYWTYWKAGKTRCSKNLLLYADRHNKITGELECVHLELRFLRPDAVRRQGIHSVSDLFDINPSALFEKHVKWIPTDIVNQHIMKIVRQAVKEDMDSYRGRQTTSMFTDKYRANLHRRVRAILHRLGQDRAQVIMNEYPDRVMKAITPAFTIPTQLTWGSMNTATTKPVTDITQYFQKRGVSLRVNT